MPINENIFIMADKICSDEQLTMGLISLKSFEEAYEYCSNISGGYTQEEFYDWLEEFFAEVEEEGVFSRELGEDELDKISAGTGFFKKITAASLAALTLGTTAISTRTSAAGTEVADGGTSISTSVKGKEAEQKPSFWQKYKNYMIGAAITVALAVATYTGYNYYKNEKSGLNKMDRDLRNDAEWANKSWWEKFRSYSPWASGAAKANYAEVEANIKAAYAGDDGAKAAGFKGTESDFAKYVLNKYKESGTTSTDANLFDGTDESSFTGRVIAGLKRIKVAASKDRVKGKDGTDYLKSNISPDDIGLIRDFNTDVLPNVGAGEKLKAAAGIKDEEDSKAKKDVVANALKWFPAGALASAGYLKLKGAMESIGEFSKDVNKTKTLGTNLNDAFDWVMKKANYIIRDMTNEEIPPEQAVSNFQNYVVPSIQGQERAKEQIGKHCARIMQQRDKYRKTVARAKEEGRDVSKIEKHGGAVMYWAGPSGVGKTMMAKALVNNKVLTQDNDPTRFMVVTPQMLREGSRDSVMDQLLGGPDWQERMNQSEGTPTRKSLAEFMEMNGDADCVLLIDDVDKFWDKSVDEALARIIEGEIKINGKSIKTNNLTVIVTSNETNSFFPTKHKSTTYGIQHDQSRMNRFMLAEFENLSVEHYERIARNHIKQELDYWQKDYTKYDVDSGKDFHVPVDVDIEDSVYTKIAKCMREVDNGARTLAGFIGDINVEVLYRVLANKNNNFYFDNKKIHIGASIGKGAIGEGGRVQPKLNVVSWLEGEQRPEIPEDVDPSIFAPPEAPKETVTTKPVKQDVDWDDDEI